MQAGNGLIMLATPTPEYQAPRHHRGGCEPAQKWSAVPYIVDGVLVYVGDIDAHAAQAKRQGAVIITDVEADQYGKFYRAEDPEGHRWMFMERA
jgi:PhnB protein